MTGVSVTKSVGRSARISPTATDRRRGMARRRTGHRRFDRPMGPHIPRTRDLCHPPAAIRRRRLRAMVGSAVTDAVDLTPVQRVLEEMAPVGHEHVIPLLQAIQTSYGYLPQPALAEASARTDIPLSHLYGVATFYAQFYLAPHARHTIRVCRGTACHVRGRQAIQDAVDTHLGIHDGQSTPDGRYGLETVACLGTCFLAPVVMVDHDYFGSVTPGKVPEILEGYG